MDEKINLSRIRNRLKTVYHNCHAAACSNYADADTEGNEAFRDVFMSEGRAYEVCAGWIEALIRHV